MFAEEDAVLDAGNNDIDAENDATESTENRPESGPEVKREAEEEREEGEEKEEETEKEEEARRRIVASDRTEQRIPDDISVKMEVDEE